MRQPDSLDTNDSATSKNHAVQLHIDSLRFLFDTMPAGIVYFEMIYEGCSPKDMRVLFANTKFESMTGLHDAKDKLISELLPGIYESDPEFFMFFKNVSCNSKTEKQEMYINALHLWLSIAVHSPQQNYFVAIIDNIDDRKHNEEAILFKTALLEAQLNSSIEGILIVDKQGKKILQNQRTVDLWKIPQHIADNPEDQTQVEHVKHMTKNPEHFTKAVNQLYAEPEKIIRDELELIDGTVLDRFSAPVIGKDGHNYGRIWAFHDITERKNNEEALRQKTALLEALLNSTIDGIMVMAPNGRKVIENQRTNDLWKIPPELQGNQNILKRREHINKMNKDPESFVQNISNLVQNSQNTCRDEIELIDGTVLDRYSAPVMGTDGHYYGRIWTFRDITDRKMVEEALRQKTALLEAQLNSSIEGILVVDRQGKKVLQNQRTIDLWKIPEHIANNPDDQIQVAHVQHMTKNPDQFASEVNFLYNNPEETIHDELELIDGTILDRYSAPVFGKDGHHYGRIWAFRDITERKQAEACLAAEKELLSVTLRSIGDGVITTDIRGNVVIINKVAEELTGWQQDDAFGKSLDTVFTIIDENTRMRSENPFDKILATGQKIESSGNILIISRNGTERVIANSGAPIKNSSGETIGVVLAFRDITERRRVIDNMQRIDKLDSLGILAGGIAHDFNNLLCVIFGFIEMARKQSSENETVTKYLDNALTAFNRAKDLTKQLLTFSKGGAPRKKTGNLGVFVQGTSAFALSGSNVSSRFDIAQNLWLCDFDENQIAQVLDNIIINALESMPSGGCITILAQNVTIADKESLYLSKGNFVKISITDTGNGIPQENLKRIFDPFFTTKRKGSGLGLTTCYSIIQKHDGVIDVESIQGKGTTFHIFLPASQKEIPLINIPNTLPHSGDGIIILMDDEYLVREIASEMLKDMGYTIVKAKDGEEALQTFKNFSEKGENIKCAFFDLTIPGGMGGREAISKLRPIAPNLPVFASSGYSEDPVIARPAEFGFTDSISKPFRQENLSELLNKHFKS